MVYLVRNREQKSKKKTMREKRRGEEGGEERFINQVGPITGKRACTSPIRVSSRRGPH